jgi:hypothetical protein
MFKMQKQFKVDRNAELQPIRMKMLSQCQDLGATLSFINALEFQW